MIFGNVWFPGACHLSVYAIVKCVVRASSENVTHCTGAFLGVWAARRAMLLIRPFPASLELTPRLPSRLPTYLCYP